MKDVFNVGVNLEPIGIRKCLGLLEGNTFKVEGRQEDAEEFLSHLLNGLHDEMLRVNVTVLANYEVFRFQIFLGRRNIC